MIVELEYNWFAPSISAAGKLDMSVSGQVYWADAGPQEIPDEYRDILPSTAKVVGGDPRKTKVKKKAPTAAQRAAAAKKLAEKKAKEKEDMDAHTLNVDPGEAD